MEVFLLRHATRNFTMGDVPLNDEGLEQAQDLSKDPRLQQVASLLCSPKKRALMTIEPLSQLINVSVEVIDDLDQMRQGETESHFVERVRKVTTKIEEGVWKGPLLLCSHSDWLGVAAQILPSDEIDLKYHMFNCAEYMTFKIEDGLWYSQS